jgi:integrase
MHVPAKSDQKLKKWEFPKKSGIWIREFLYTHTFKGKQGTYSAYQVTVPAKITGKTRKRKQCNTIIEAQKFATQILAGYKKQGEDYFRATDDERKEFSTGIPKLRENGITLTEAIEFAIKRLRPKGGERSVSGAVDELVASKKLRLERGDLRERSYKDFKNRASKFSTAFDGLPIKELALDSITDWLLGLELEPRTTKNYLSIISEVLKYAYQKQYIAESPLERLTDSDRKELIGNSNSESQPSILSLEESKRLLESALAHSELDLLGPVVLGLFCGIRIEELKRLNWANVRDQEDRPFVTISAEMAKKRRIRNIDIPKVALKWLSLIKVREGVVARGKHHDDYRRRFNQLLQSGGFGHTDEKGKWVSDWETNAMRHSFGSYHYALHGNPLETSRQLGHKSNDQVLFDHYRALATKEQGEAFFSIVPPKSESKLVEFVG